MTTQPTDTKAAMVEKAMELKYGQRVTVCDETSGAFGRVGRYEGVISEDLDALRVRFHFGVIVAQRHQLLCLWHPVRIHRDLKASGVRAPRAARCDTPACYEKDYGKTSLELATEAFWDSLDEDIDAAARGRLAGEMLYRQRADRQRAYNPPRRLSRAAIRHRRDGASEKRWLRARSAIRRAYYMDGVTWPFGVNEKPNGIPGNSNGGAR